MSGSLDIDRDVHVPCVSRVEKIDGNNQAQIKNELDRILTRGWQLVDIFTKGSNTFAVFSRPKRQKG